MALTQLTADVENISKLDNYPPDDVGMTSAILKARFDKGSVDIKAYINGILLAQLDKELADKLSAITLDSAILTALAEAKNSGVFDGADGLAVELQNSGSYIQWRYVGGSAWTNLVLLTTLKGDKGDSGATGTQGATGSTGATGAQGVQGIQGVKGDTGLQGIQGIAGTNGVNGTNGIDGKTAYASALTGGYIGTEANFNADLAAMHGLAANLEVLL